VFSSIAFEVGRFEAMIASQAKDANTKKKNHKLPTKTTPSLQASIGYTDTSYVGNTN
jgi:hypothetical protein